MKTQENSAVDSGKPTIIVPKEPKNTIAPEIADDADMKSFRRKWAIINMVIDSEDGYTIEELAAHFGVSPRTIRRDLGIFDVVFNGFDSTLEKWGKRRFTMEGIPIGSDHGDESRGLNREELVAFCVAQRLMGPLRGTAFGDNMRSGCDKMRHCLRKDTLERVDRLVSMFCRPEFKRPANNRSGRFINTIVSGLYHGRGLKILYYSVELERRKVYTVIPVRLLYNDGFIYLVAYKYNDVADSKNDDPRPYLWKLSRIHGVKLTTIQFRHPENFEFDKYFNGIFSLDQSHRDQITVKVRFHRKVVSYLNELNLKWVKKLEPVDKEKDFYVGQLSAEPEAFVRWILSFGESAEVLEPREMCNRVKDELRAVCRSYRS